MAFEIQIGGFMKKHRFGPFFFLLAAVALIVGSHTGRFALLPSELPPSQAQAAELAQPPLPSPGAPGGLSKVLVTYRSATDRLDVEAVSRLGGHVRFQYRLIPTLAVELPEPAVSALRSNPRVLRVEADHRIQAFDHATNTGNPELEAAWGVEHIGAGVVHTARITGTGVRVAVIDSGVDYNHPDLAAVYADGYDFINGDSDPFDDLGHGTHVAGITAGVMNGAGVVGVAPGVQLYGLKVLGADGQGDYSHLIAALDWAALNNIRVVNMSLGGNENTQALHDAISAAYNAGIVLVAASGNVSTFPEIFFGCPVRFPAAYSEVLATTFTGQTDSLTGLSCTGPEVDLGAPGDSITSTVPTGGCTYCDPSGYYILSGTSMASPHVAGAATLLLAQGISDSNGNGRVNDDVKNRLCSTASLAGDMLPTDPRYPNWYGCGILNADGAMLGSTPTPNATPTPASTAAPTLTMTPSPTATPTGTPSSTATPSATPTSTAGATATATLAASLSPTNTPPASSPSNTGLVSPATQQASTGGDGGGNAGFEGNPGGALTDGGGVAVDTNSGNKNSSSCTSDRRDSHWFYGFDLAVPASASVTGIEVRLDASVDSAAGSPAMCIMLSSNGGATWTAAKSTGVLTTSEATYMLGSPSDTWGRTWTPTDLSPSNFRARAVNVANSTARDYSLDWIAVRVTYQ